MSKKLLVATSILVGSSFMPYIVIADTATTAVTKPTDSTAAISKDTWLNGVIPLLPNLICKGFTKDPELKQRLTDIKMSFDQCVAAIPESVNKCKQQIYANIPDSINNDSAATWGKTLGECIGKDFAVKYLIPK